MDRFEESPAWQKARELHRLVYAATRKRPVADDYEYCRQIRRASLSIMNNIAEGFERYRLGEVHQFLSIAKGSAAEVRSMVYAGLDVGHLDQASFQQLTGAAMDVTRLVAAWRSSVERERQASKELREAPLTWDEPEHLLVDEYHFARASTGLRTKD